MPSNHRQIALQAFDSADVEQGCRLSLSSLRLGLGLVFFGLMLTLGVTLSLAAHVGNTLASSPDHGVEHAGAVSRTLTTGETESA
jgi:hypothetical protein